MERTSTIQARVRKRLVHRFNEALTFLVATAWTLLFDDIFVALTGENPSLPVRMLHACVFTLAVVVISVVLDAEE